jgi:hypothetical protein
MVQISGTADEIFHAEHFVTAAAAEAANAYDSNRGNAMRCVSPKNYNQ